MATETRPFRAKPHNKIVALDLATKTEKDFLNVPDESLYRAFFSWDDNTAIGL